MPKLGSLDKNIRSGLPRRQMLGGMLAGGGLIAASSGGLISRAALAAASGKGGFSTSRLKYLTDGMNGYIDSGDVAGVLTLLYRHGELAHSDLLGFQDQEAKIPLKRDTIFRIASMSKPVTAVAALILLEEGKFRLEDPVDHWLPELANRKVLKNPSGPLEDTYPSPRPITVGDLMTQRLGMPSALGGTEGPILAAMATLRGAESMDDWLKRESQLPLVYPPGERFILRQRPPDVLGFLVARASGMSVSPISCSRRLFGPLGMVDTAFWVPEAKLPRLSVAYAHDPATGKRSISGPSEQKPLCRAAESTVGRRRPGFDRRRLYEIRPHAAPERNVGRQAYPFAQDRRTDDVGLSDAGAAQDAVLRRHDILERAGPRAGQSVSGAGQHSAPGRAVIGRTIWLERRLWHAVAERSEGGDDGHPHDPDVVPGNRAAHPARFPHAGLSVVRRLIDQAVRRRRHVVPTSPNPLRYRPGRAGRPY